MVASYSYKKGRMGVRVASRPASLAKPSCNFAHSPAPACPPHIVPGSQCVGNWPPYPAVGHSGGHSLGQQPAPASVPPFPLLDPQTPLPGRWLPLQSQLPKKLPTLTGYTPSHQLLSPAQALARSLAGPSADTGHHWVFFKAPGTCSWSYCFPSPLPSEAKISLWMQHLPPSEHGPQSF